MTAQGPEIAELGPRLRRLWGRVGIGAGCHRREEGVEVEGASGRDTARG